MYGTVNFPVDGLQTPPTFDRVQSYYTTAFLPTSVSFDKRAVKTTDGPVCPVRYDAMIINCLFHYNLAMKEAENILYESYQTY